MPRILIVDDDLDLLTVVKSLLHKRGFEVLAYSDWDLAWESIKTTKPQLIVLDVFLTGIDGLDVCRKLKTSPFTRQIPIIVFSSFPNIAETAIFEYGADDFIAKPFEVNEFVKKIHFVLSKNHQSA
ncbi:MAG: response regulator [Ginsengibacter sp.]